MPVAVPEVQEQHNHFVHMPPYVSGYAAHAARVCSCVCRRLSVWLCVPCSSTLQVTSQWPTLLSRHPLQSARSLQHQLLQDCCSFQACGALQVSVGAPT